MSERPACPDCGSRLVRDLDLRQYVCAGCGKRLPVQPKQDQRQVHRNDPRQQGPI